jgi:ribonuclease HI
LKKLRRSSVERNIEIYADGACSGNPGPGGWGAVVLVEGTIKELGERYFHHTTNNIMELAAVTNSLDFIVHLYGIDQYNIIIYTDSAYIHNCWKDGWWKNWVKNGWLNSKKQPVANQHLWEELIPFFKLSNFSIVKVKGHSGNKYNEIVDQIATGKRIPKN